MNTHIDLYAMRTSVAPLLAEAEQIFHEVESRFTRFAPASELSRFNASTTANFDASPAFLDLLRRAIEMHRRTHGVFECAILDDLVAAGYDRSFEEIARDGASPVRLSAQARASVSDIVIDGGSVGAPAGLTIDFGGIGKGYAVDCAITHLRDAHDVLVSAGGDMRAAGNGPGGEGWLVSVAPAPGDAPLGILRLRDQALATSTTATRNWRRAGVRQHHIIDPRTRRPADSGVRAVSVLAATAVEADVFAKTALILGVDEGLAFLDAQRTPGFIVRDDGNCVQSADWPGLPAGK
jgi:thiamine biosynthesis lipoprotein